MSRTITVRGGSKLSPGWHEVTIKKATFDTNDNDSTYLDVWFNELPETLNMRVYEAFDKEGNEFAVGSIFRFANAGITSVLDGPNGEKSVTIDDNPNVLRDRTLNVYLYPDPKNSKYSRVLKQPAPTVFSNDVDTFTEEDVKYWMHRAEGYYEKYVKDGAPSSNGTTGTTITLKKEAASETADIPF
ncbi:hypothetical protein CL614_07720 [archaeon]|nr:hypothetical protein [archaeon]|tara:strand:+ start:211 stop:768 length:558 start_codon:yes stop_codon:yes gene_type:complete